MRLAKLCDMSPLLFLNHIIFVVAVAAAAAAAAGAVTAVAVLIYTHPIMVLLFVKVQHSCPLATVALHPCSRGCLSDSPYFTQRLHSLFVWRTPPLSFGHRATRPLTHQLLPPHRAILLASCIPSWFRTSLNALLSFSQLRYCIIGTCTGRIHRACVMCAHPNCRSDRRFGPIGVKSSAESTLCVEGAHPTAANSPTQLNRGSQHAASDASSSHSIKQQYQHPSQRQPQQQHHQQGPRG